MNNPFEEFRDYAAPPEQKIPLDQILEAHASVMSRLEEGYKLLVSDEAEEGAWQPDADSIVRVYEHAEGIVAEMEFEAADIEAFCLHATQSSDLGFFLMGPLGLYLSALCNACTETEIRMNLGTRGTRIPLLGYRLRTGLSLTVEGDLGDLVGISLDGGHLEIRGNVGRYLGAGMTKGRTDIKGEAGRFIGEQMIGGEIHLSGKIGGMGKPLGGEIYHRSRRVYPSEASGTSAEMGS